ncbi:Uma2 family endonuclease [Chondromyces apiculatus]|uniref:Putative restriction endonuclease domain-containing protein n=1 Tax=Chondromyces apiculatus DSM 436 TaxID=1192034 RepID=A0A017TIH3_9BACT|nr:Uma2 family endonuclease [Chondromyces apiculatus]EYF08431.1 Hypothetical protein CAP_3960 [Chondromyces apiculatus DSM 436]
MTEPVQNRSLSFADYLALERDSDIKHEHLDGEVYAMSGGTPAHSLIADNVSAELRSALRGRPCRVFNSDMRIRVQATGLATYPDISVFCGKIEREPADANTLVNPLVLVEVLSPSSEAYDRGDKFAHYRRIPSLHEYVLVSQSRRRVEFFRRTEDGRWIFDAAEQGSIDLASPGCSLSLDEVYLGVFDDTPSTAG